MGLTHHNMILTCRNMIKVGSVARANITSNRMGGSGRPLTHSVVTRLGRDFYQQPSGPERVDISDTSPTVNDDKTLRRSGPNQSLHDV